MSQLLHKFRGLAEKVYSRQIHDLAAVLFSIDRTASGNHKGDGKHISENAQVDEENVNSEQHTPIRLV